jgi:hypothetical protein
MGLFKKKMQDPVKGTAKVMDIEGGLGGGGMYGGTSVWATGRMKLTVTADGVPPTDVDWKGQIRCKYCPSLDQTIPVMVDRANPQTISIKWTELPTAQEVQRQETQKIRAEADESVEEARQIWRENLESGYCTQAQFDAEMRKLDEA